MESTNAQMEDVAVLSEETPRAAPEDRDLLRRLLAEVTEIRKENQQLKSQVTSLTTKTRRQLFQKSKDSDPECSVSQFIFFLTKQLRSYGQRWASGYTRRSHRVLKIGVKFVLCKLLFKIIPSLISWNLIFKSISIILKIRPTNNHKLELIKSWNSAADRREWQSCKRLLMLATRASDTRPETQVVDAFTLFYFTHVKGTSAVEASWRRLARNILHNA